MKLIELANHINQVLKASPKNKNLTVCIPNKCGGLCSPTIPVKCAVQGFDWTNGKYLIVPEEDMVKKPIKELGPEEGLSCRTCGTQCTATNRFLCQNDHMYLWTPKTK